MTTSDTPEAQDAPTERFAPLKNDLVAVQYQQAISIMNRDLQVVTPVLEHFDQVAGTNLLEARWLGFVRSAYTALLNPLDVSMKIHYEIDYESYCATWMHTVRCLDPEHQKASLFIRLHHAPEGELRILEREHLGFIPAANLLHMLDLYLPDNGPHCDPRYRSTYETLVRQVVQDAMAHGGDFKFEFGLMQPEGQCPTLAFRAVLKDGLCLTIQAFEPGDTAMTEFEAREQLKQSGYEPPAIGSVH
jgi:hypothetical protein